MQSKNESKFVFWVSYSQRNWIRGKFLISSLEMRTSGSAPTSITVQLKGSCCARRGSGCTERDRQTRKRRLIFLQVRGERKKRAKLNIKLNIKTDEWKVKLPEVYKYDRGGESEVQDRRRRTRGQRGGGIPASKDGKLISS